MLAVIMLTWTMEKETPFPFVPSGCPEPCPPLSHCPNEDAISPELCLQISFSEKILSALFGVQMGKFT